MRAGSIEIGTRRLIVFIEYHLGLLVSMAALHVTFTVAAECAGSTEIPGVQWYSCHG